jgi:glutamyl-tRNA reductase
MTLLLVGTSHRVAPVELRECLAVELPRAAAFAERLAGDGEAVVLSTCNRVCLYLVSDEAEAAREHVLRELAAVASRPPDALEPMLYTKVGDDAARHLLRVAAGLDSLIPGEAQILGQVKAAYEAADRAGAVGPTLHQLFRQALHAGKRVRHETAIGESPASVSSAAAELALRVFGELEHCRVLLIGAGKMGELAAANLIARGARSLVVVNRSLAPAQAVAERYGGRAVGLPALRDELGAADVVVSSTGASETVLGRADVAAAMRVRRGRPMFLIDIAVPRDLDPSINELDGCYLYDIDDLQRVVDEGLAARSGQLATAEAIIQQELEEFRAWQRSRDVVPAIVQLRRRAEQIRAGEHARLAARLDSLDDRQRRAVESLTAQIVNKLLHAPTVRLKEAAATPAGPAYVETLRELFGLDEPEA